MKSQYAIVSGRPGQVGRKARQAFTLVELLVVITIIGILVALLIPAVSGVMGNAKEARMGMEVASLAQALEAYKNENLAYPPDFSFAGGQKAQDLAQLNAHLARKFRYRDKVNDVVPMEGLDPAEALVFWLSGLSSDDKLPLKRREAYPVAAGPVKGPKPYFTFDQARLDDRDGDGWPEYYPEGGQMPYVYLVSQNYGQLQKDGSYLAVAHPILDAGSGSNVAVRAYAAELEGAAVKRFAAAEKYQILCAGRDNLFGAGAHLNAGSAPTYPDGIGYAEADEDNLTSFSEGRTLQAAIP